ncbi:hypothetical protein BAE44_0025766 [Dichanthelium oligosanthes]|uniref:Uncharacterized protein n=1 Tax=Dichanthelium oligosanthes TaxID=888268 RepID=A0A1E5UK79_9POAL|nr:hypothetical protein BAE44_0025766 [Dichanthelium oligosanthes]
MKELVTMKEDDDYDGDIGRDNGDDDVRSPIPAARVEALDEDDAYYGDRSTADAFPTSIGEAPCPAPVPAFHVQALSEIEVTGWGEAEPGDGEQARGVENVDGACQQAQEYAEQEDVSSSGSRQEGGRPDSSSDGEGGEDNKDDNERYDNMSYSSNNMSYSSDNEISDYDEGDAYYASVAEAGTEVEDGEQQPRPTTQPEHQKNSSLEDMYQLPLDLMYNASFHATKVRAATEDRFLLVNLQTFDAAGDFQSLLHNRDLWADEQVKDVVRGSFVFLLL